jgi:hypothetical protein
MRKVLVILLVLALANVSWAASATKSLSITINAAPLVITTSSLPGGTVGSTYTASLAATGGRAPYSWSWSPAVGSQLPPGLTLNATTGQISGTPTADGSFSFVVTVTDSQTLAQTSVSVTANFGASD